MRLRYVFQNKKQELFSKFRLPSAWIPQPTYSNCLEDYLEATLTEIASLPIRNAKSNISKGELNALKAIRNDHSLVNKPFDKGRGIAILNRSDYIKPKSKGNCKVTIMNDFRVIKLLKL